MFDVSKFTVKKLVEGGMLPAYAPLFRKEGFMDPVTWDIMKLKENWEDILESFFGMCVLGGEEKKFLQMILEANASVGFSLMRKIAEVVGQWKKNDNPILADKRTEISQFFKTYLEQSGVPADLLNGTELISSYGDPLVSLSEILSTYSAISGNASAWKGFSGFKPLRKRGVIQVSKKSERVEAKSLEGIKIILTKLMGDLHTDKVYMSTKEFEGLKKCLPEDEESIYFGEVSFNVLSKVLANVPYNPKENWVPITSKAHSNMRVSARITWIKKEKHAELEVSVQCGYDELNDVDRKTLLSLFPSAKVEKSPTRSWRSETTYFFYLHKAPIEIVAKPVSDFVNFSIKEE